ncbi:hypothetical protein IC799_01075 [Acinetobacter seifertii]|uniref:hypothetical protein n=1 Tax=Acinetobacter seifertii TaxID=1530123 RepID=UPI00168A522D|nr:hypothetical protein [Acinetobacter seifertii]QNW91634.1 hypothetical protein IC799_01075 [Acinetobacter seifertii]
MAKSNINILKDKVRGMIGSYRSYDSLNKINIRKSIDIDNQVAEILSTARETLASDEQAIFLIWVKESINYQLRSYPKAYGIVKDDENELKDQKKDVEWIIIYLKAYEKKIFDYLNYKRKINYNLFNGDYENALQLLDDLDRELNESLWSINLRITILQTFYGLEEQKSYLEKVKKKYKYGLIPFLAHRASQKNEPDVNIKRYHINLKKFLKENKDYISDSLRTFIEFKLLDANNYGLKDLLDFADIQLNFNFIDFYETVSQISKRNVKLKNISYEQFFGNKKIKKISHILEMNYDESLIETIFSNIFSVNEHGAKNVINDLRVIIRKILLMDENFDEYIERLNFLSEIFSFNDNFKALKNLVDFFNNFNPIFYQKYIDECKAFLGSKSDFLDYISNDDEILDLYRNIFNKKDGIIVNYDVMPSYFENVRCLVDFQNLILSNIDDNLLEDCTSYFIRNKNSSKLIQFVLDDPLDFVEKIEITKSNFLSILILLDKYNAVKYSEEVHSEICYLVQNELEELEVNFPSDIVDLKELHLNENHLIYFYRNICVEDVLDSCDAIESSKMVREERRKILSNLIKLDKEHSDQYHDEIISITSELKLRSGMEYIDGSRIHVDENALRQIIFDEFLESFKRYESLVKAGIGVSENIEEVYEQFLKKKGTSNYLEIPDNDADQLLFEIITDLQTMFFFHHQYGLDSFLSKRIRHNSIAGFIRSAPEEFNLVTKKPSDTEDYRDNEYWIQGVDSPSLQNSINKVLKNFTLNFDTYITDIRNKYLQIKSKNNPDGLIVPWFPNEVIPVLRSGFQKTFDIDEFITASFNIFWSALEQELEKFKNKMKEDFSSEISQIYDQLLSELSAIPYIRNHNIYKEIYHAITNSKTKTLTQMQYAAEWFNRSKISYKYSFTFDEWIDIAIEAALARHSSAKLEVIKNIKNDTQLMTTHLFEFADIIQILVGNVSEHVHIDKVPLNIDINLDFEKQIGIYTFSNPVTSETIRRGTPLLEDIRRNIQQDNYMSKLTTEGNSGLYKIASIILDKNDKKSSMEFYYDDESFVLKLTQMISWDSSHENISR